MVAREVGDMGWVGEGGGGRRKRRVCGRSSWKHFILGKGPHPPVRNPECGAKVGGACLNIRMVVL